MSGYAADRGRMPRTAPGFVSRVEIFWWKNAAVHKYLWICGIYLHGILVLLLGWMLTDEWVRIWFCLQQWQTFEHQRIQRIHWNPNGALFCGKTGRAHAMFPGNPFIRASLLTVLIDIHKYTNTQMHKYANIQIFKYASRYKYTTATP